MIDFYKEFELKKAVLIGLLFSIGISQQKWNAEFMREYGGVTYAPNSDKPYTGKVFSLYDDGKKKEEGKYRDGKKDGLWTSWYSNGNKKVVVFYTGEGIHEETVKKISYYEN